MERMTESSYRLKKGNNSSVSTVLLSLLILFFIIGIFFYSKEVFQAAKDGINLWFHTVFPALLPFLIGTNLLIGLGVVNFLGTILEPVMRPLFNVPGIGAFAWMMGMSSGYPIGAKITADLRTKKQITAVEAQRLMSFCNNSGPLFMLGAVSIGMFNSTAIGFFIMAIHYLSAMTTGLLFRFYRYGEKPASASFPHKGILRKAYHSLLEARKKDGRKLGLLMGDSVMNAMDIIVQIGGFIILFCVIVKLLELFSILKYLSILISPLTTLLGIDPSLHTGLLFGLLEITNGAKLISAASAPLMQKVILTAGVIAWGGFSIHAQTTSIISKTDIKVGVYLGAKGIHGLLAGLYAYLFYPLVENHVNRSISTFHMTSPKVLHTFLQASIQFAAAAGILLFLALMAYMFFRKQKRMSS